MAASSPAVFRLPASIDATAAGAIRDGLLERRGQPLIVDASDVQRAATQTLQVLMAAALSWARDGQAFHISGASPAFADACQLLGLTVSHLPEV